MNHIHEQSEPAMSAVLMKDDILLHDAINRGAKQDSSLPGDHTFYIRSESQCVLACPDANPPWVVMVTIGSVYYDATDKVTKIAWRNPRGFFVKSPNAYMPFAPGT
jgi:hypothetical protein